MHAQVKKISFHYKQAENRLRPLFSSIVGLNTNLMYDAPSQAKANSWILVEDNLGQYALNIVGLNKLSMAVLTLNLSDNNVLGLRSVKIEDLEIHNQVYDFVVYNELLTYAPICTAQYVELSRNSDVSSEVTPEPLFTVIENDFEPEENLKHFNILAMIDNLEADLLQTDIIFQNKDETFKYNGRISIADQKQAFITIKEKDMDNQNNLKSSSPITVSLGNIAIANSDLLELRAGHVIEIPELAEMTASIKVGDKEIAQATLNYNNDKLQLEVVSLERLKNLKNQETFPKNKRFIQEILNTLK